MATNNFHGRKKTFNRGLIIVIALMALIVIAIWQNFFTGSGVNAYDTQPTLPVLTAVQTADPPITTPAQIAGEGLQPQPTSNPPSQPPLPPAPAEPAEPAASAPPAKPADTLSQQLFQQGLAAFKAQNIITARDKLSQAVANGLEPAQDSQARQLLNQAADQWLFSRNIFEGDSLCQRYKVASGDVLARIGKTSNVPYQLLMRINNIQQAQNLAVDQSIKVVNGPFHVVVERNLFRLSVYLGNILVRTYDVGLGAPGQNTPTGLWLVKLKQPNPAWTDPETGKNYHPNDPENPLGEHWIALDGLEGDAKGRIGFGIHGTIKPEEIGHNTSRGCIRLRNEDVAVLYDLLTEGQSQVRIIDAN